MKKILVGLVSLGLLFSSVGLALAESPRQAVFFLRTDTNPVPSGSTITYEVVANTMGQSVKDIDLNIVFDGQIPQTPKFGVVAHPDHQARLHSSQGLMPHAGFAYFSTSDGYQVEISMTAADNQGFNEGSAAIPIAKITVPTYSHGLVKAYIAHTSRISYIDDSALGFKNYTPSMKPIWVTVGEGGAQLEPIPHEDEAQAPSEIHPGAPVATMMPSPSPMASIRPTPSPMASLRPTPSPEENLPPYATSRPTPSPETESDSVYDEEFARLEAEINRLQGQVDDQAERIGILERIIDSLQGWWQGLWRR